MNQARYHRVLLAIFSSLLLTGSVFAASLLSHIQQRIVDVQTDDDLQPLSMLAGQYPLVLLGEATHGSQEFYHWRAHLSKTLITQHNYRLIAIEAPWSFTLKVNAYVTGESADYQSAKELLKSFDNWPEWMWRNQVTAEFVEWLKDHNHGLAKEKQVYFLGLDLYEADQSMAQLLAFVRQQASQFYPYVQSRLACFSSAQEESWQSAVDRGDVTCHQQLYQVRQLLSQVYQALGENRFDYLSAEQQAQVAYHAELFYRFNRSSQTQSWNVRTWHMWQTLLRLMDYLGTDTKAIVWAHNTHIADSGASPDYYSPGSITLGYLAKQHQTRLPVFSVGFATDQGQVLAGKSWGDDQQTMTLPKARAGSYEHLLSQLESPRFYWVFNDDDRAHPVFNQAGSHRAVGVVYNPDDERGNYLPTALPWRYDALIFIEKTTALKTLD